MEAPYQEKIVQCNFPGVNGVHYMCFHNKICCDEGCCQKSPFVIFRIWYIWIVLLGIFFFCSGGLRCCKLLRNPQSSRRSARSRSQRYAEQDPRPDFNRFNNDESLWRYLDGLGEEDTSTLAIERYLACREAKSNKQNRNSDASPPPYNSLRKSATVLEISEPPPQYNMVCKSSAPKTVQVVEVHEALSKQEDALSETTAETEQPNIFLAEKSNDTVIDIGDMHIQRFENREPERKDI